MILEKVSHVVDVCLVHACDKVGSGVAPFELLLELFHVHVDGIEDCVHVVVAVLLLVQIACDELGRGIACAAAHSAEARINDTASAELLHEFDELNGQSE